MRLPFKVLMLCTAASVGCAKSAPPSEPKEPVAWWQSIRPDVTIDKHEFYSRDCSITQVTTDQSNQAARIIFKVPSRAFTDCKNKGPLTYDGKYIELTVCEMGFGAGGCSTGRYRSADLENWEEYIGVTWIDSEEYEAWRKLGSTSTKADSVKRVVK